MSDMRDIFKYGKYREIFKENDIAFEDVLYSNEKVPDEYKDTEPFLTVHVGVFGTMLDEYAKNKSIKWIGTAGR